MLQPEKVNPLKKFYRQPKLYISLPSSGNYYPVGALIPTETNQYPVYAMTAKDEITMKTPDALLNGQSTVDLIQSCIPNITNAWVVPSIDIDALLIAIRIASYSENIDVELTLPNTTITKTYTADLRPSLDKLYQATFDPLIQISDDMVIFIKPLTYKEFTKNAIKTLEEQRIFQIVNDDTISDEVKLELFNKSFSRIADISINMITKCIDRIEIPGESVTDINFIQDFIDNADKDFFKAITSHLEEQKAKFQIPPFKVIATEEEQGAGAPAEFDAPLTLDISSFFVSSSPR